MLYLNVSEVVLKKWGRTIDLYFTLHLGGFAQEIKSVNLLIESTELKATSSASGEGILYTCMLEVIPNKGSNIGIMVERENCGAAIEHCFAKAKRTLIRRSRGLSELSPSPVPRIENATSTPPG